MVERTCIEEGCDKIAVAHGWCAMHYARVRRWGSPEPRKRGTPAVDRLVAKIDRRGDDVCWPWTGHCAEDGYGRIGVQDDTGKWTMALTHRLAYATFVGPIPDGLNVLHHCDNPPCCNWVTCLFVGTQADNNADRDAKGRGRVSAAILAKREQTECIHGHPLSGDNLSITATGHRRCKRCVADRQRGYRQKRRGG